MTYKEAGKKNWETRSGSGAERDEIKVGAIQRIADACELMAQNHARLISERDDYKHWYKDELERANQLERQNTAFRGVITKLKKKAKEGRS